MPLEKYKLYESKVITENFEEFIHHTDVAFNIFKSKYNSTDSTWLYKNYNIFSLTSTSNLYYKLYKELRDCIKDYIGNDVPIWMESWLNYHSYEDLDNLKWHNHDYLIHGYVAIDPKNTVTQFEDFEINNKPGQIYIGLGQSNMRHNVKALEKYEGYRSTLAFDCIIKEDEFHNNNMFFPLI